MSIETFVEQLKEGKYSEAVDALKTHLKEQSAIKIDESKSEVLSMLGFKLTEKKMVEEEDNKPKDTDKDGEIDDEGEGKKDEDDKKADPNKVSEAVEKIACTECDAVNTKAAWQKNKGTCPSCKKSTKGVAEAIVNSNDSSKNKIDHE